MIRSIFLAAALAMTLTSLANCQAIIGSWFTSYSGADGKGSVVITFLPNGVYTMAEDGDRTLDPSGKDGMERGTYTWNPSTNAFSKKTLVDTTGEWGLSHSAIKKISVSGNKMIMVADDGKFTLNRVTSANNKIVGGWYAAAGGGSYAVVTFLSDGSFYMVQDGKPEGGGKTGMERGTYTWDPVTQSFTRKILVDTNGGWGFSDVAKRTIGISGNKLTLSVQGEKFVLARVIAPN